MRLSPSGEDYILGTYEGRAKLSLMDPVKGKSDISFKCHRLLEPRMEVVTAATNCEPRNVCIHSVNAVDWNPVTVGTVVTGVSGMF